MNNIPPEKINIAENVVARWFSLTRGKDLMDPVTIKILKVNIAQALVNHGRHEAHAHLITQKVIQEWANECDGLPVDAPEVIEVLEVRIAKAL